MPRVRPTTRSELADRLARLSPADRDRIIYWLCGFRRQTIWLALGELKIDLPRLTEPAARR